MVVNKATSGRKLNTVNIFSRFVFLLTISTKSHNTTTIMRFQVINVTMKIITFNHKI